MDEDIKRRIVGAVVLFGGAFFVSLLLPRPGADAPLDAGMKREIIDLNAPAQAEVPGPLETAAVAAAAPQPSAEQTTSPDPAADAAIDPAAMTSFDEETAASDVTVAAPEDESAPASKLPTQPVAAAEVPAQPVPKPSVVAQAAPSTKLESKPAPKALAQAPAKAPPAPVVAAKPAPTAAPAATTKPAPLPVTPAPAPRQRWFVQVGSFSDAEKARVEMQRLRPAPSIISPAETSNGVFYRVRLGPYASKEKAISDRDRYAQKGQVLAD